MGRGGGLFPFHFNWKLKFLDKRQTESHLTKSFSQPGLNEEGRVEMRGLWRGSNEERSQKTLAI